MSDASYQSLREAILAPRPGDGSPEVMPPLRNPLTWLFGSPGRDRAGEDGVPAGSIFDLPATRIASGWGGLAGGALAFVSFMPNLWLAAPMVLVGAPLGAFAAVAALVLFAGLVARIGLWVTLIVLASALAVGVWFFTPSTPTP